MLIPIQKFILNRLSLHKPFMGKGNACGGYKHSAILEALVELRDKQYVDADFANVTKLGLDALKNN